MGQDTIPVSEAGKKDELNWKEINDALERLTSVQDTMKRLGIPLSAVARASVLAALNIHVLETGGDPFKAMSSMTEFMHKMWISVCTGLLASTSEAIKVGSIQGQKVSETELDAMRAFVINMEMILATNHTIMADEITKVLEAQNALANSVDEQAKIYGSLAVARSLIVMAQQCVFFDMNCDIVSAKAAFTDQQHLLWEIAIANAMKLIESAVEKTDLGPSENKPN